MVESEGNGGQAVTRSGRSDFRLPPRYHPVALWQLGTFRAGTRAMPWESSTAGDGLTATLLQSWGYRRHLFRPVLSGRRPFYGVQKLHRSAERRVGKEWVSTVNSRW